MAESFETGRLLFGRYEIMRQLGTGGTSVVYLALNKKVGNQVAIKVVEKKGFDFDFLAEKDLLIELRHPSIPIIMDIEEDEAYIYMVEEYIEGVTLGTHRNNLSEAEVVNIMTQLCDVLVYLHTTFEKPILYLDLKPSNVIRMPNGHIKLIDFGIAQKHKKDKSMDTSQYGTRGYAAPEQYGLSKTDVRTDIYSLGVSMYYLLTGKNLSTPPYKLKPLREENNGVGRELEKIIMKCTETLPSKRYQNVFALQNALKAMYTISEASKDYETFLKKGNKVVTCMGIKRGMGTTHICMLLGAFYKKHGKKVAMVEWDNRDSFLKISRMYPEVYEERHYFTLKGVDYYPYARHKAFEHLMEEAYDVILVDGGDYEAISKKGNYHQSHQVLMVCGTKDWEIDLFEEYYFNRPNKGFAYLFNLTDEEVYKTVVHSMEGFNYYHMPYNPLPYELSKETETLFMEMMGEGFKAIISTQKDGKYDIKRYLKDFFQKIQKAE